MKGIEKEPLKSATEQPSLTRQSGFPLGGLELCLTTMKWALRQRVFDLQEPAITKLTVWIGEPITGRWRELPRGNGRMGFPGEKRHNFRLLTSWFEMMGNACRKQNQDRYVGVIWKQIWGDSVAESFCVVFRWFFSETKRMGLKPLELTPTEELQS